MFLYVEHTNLIKALDLEDRDALIWMLIDYMEDHTQPTDRKLQSLSKPVQVIWKIIKKDIDSMSCDACENKK